MEVFKDYAYYYNLFYGNKDYDKEAKEVHQLLQKYKTGDRCKKILNVGCGTGKHDIELSKLGYDMQGIDFSEEMIAIAKKNQQLGKNMEFLVGDSRNYRTINKFDCVISLFHVMSYQNSNEDIIQSFQTAYEALKQGGIFIFDVWYGPGVLSDKPAVRAKEIEDDTNKIIRIANPVMHSSENIVDVNYHVLITNKHTNTTQEIKETHSMRYYFEPEIKNYLEISGLKLVDCLDCSTLGETNFETWTSYFIAQKRSDNN